MTAAPWEAQGNPHSLDITEAEYFADYGEYMTSHKLELFRQSPLSFKAMTEGKLKKETKACYEFGSAFHMLALEGHDKLMAEYEVSSGPINPKTGKAYGRDTKKWAEWLEEIDATGKKPLMSGEYVAFCEMESSLISHPAASELLKVGAPEVTIRAELLPGVPCQSRIDWLNATESLARIVDLKTCNDIGGEHTDDYPCKFARDARVFGYARQMAFYRLMLSRLLDIPSRQVEVAIIAVESAQPFEVAVFEYSQATLDHAEGQVLDKLCEYRNAIEGSGFESRFLEPVTL